MSTEQNNDNGKQIKPISVAALAKEYNSSVHMFKKEIDLILKGDLKLKKFQTKLTYLQVKEIKKRLDD